MHSAMNASLPGVWQARSNSVSDESDSYFSTSDGEWSARRNASISRRSNALCKFCNDKNNNNNNDHYISILPIYSMEKQSPVAYLLIAVAQ